MFKAIAAAIAAASLTAAGFLVAGPDDPGSSANRTAYSFTWALNHGNVGKACSWVSQEWRDTWCPAPNDWRVSDKTENPDGSVTYRISKDGAPDTIVVVARHENGKWRVQSVR